MFFSFLTDRKDIRKCFFYPIFIFLVLSGCSKSDDSSGGNKSPENTVQKSSIEESISPYKIENYFWSHITGDRLNIKYIMT